MSARKHLATHWQKIGGGGSVLKCRPPCPWQSNPEQPAQAQREAHRAHRVEMGENPAPRRPTASERLKAAEATVARVRHLADVYEQNARTAGSVQARNWQELFVEDLQAALDDPHHEVEREESDVRP